MDTWSIIATSFLSLSTHSGPAAGVVKRSDVLRGQLDIDGPGKLAPLVDAVGANDGRRDAGADQQPGKCDLRDGRAVAARNLVETVEQLKPVFVHVAVTDVA